MAFVIVCEGSATARFQGKARLSPIQCLNLALFVNAEHNCVLRRSQINAHHVCELFQKLWITRELETLGQMRLKLVILPDTVNGVFADLLLLSQRAGTPMS